MKEPLIRDQYSELIESVDEDSATYGIIRKEYSDALEKIILGLEEDYTWIGSGTETEDVFFEILASEFDMLNNKGKDHTYEISGGKQDFEVLKERLDQHFSRGYDRAELAGILRSEYPETSQREFRQKDNLPSEQPYLANFGGWNNAHWHAGLERDENMDKEVLLHELRDKTHEMNKNRDMLIETPSGRDLDSDPDKHNKEAYQDAFGSLEKAYSEAGLETIRKMEKEIEEWRTIIYTPFSDIIGLDERDVGYKI